MMMMMMMKLTILPRKEASVFFRGYSPHVVPVVYSWSFPYKVPEAL
jgi:hypothetical protein